MGNLKIRLPQHYRINTPFKKGREAGIIGNWELCKELLIHIIGHTIINRQSNMRVISNAVLL